MRIDYIKLKNYRQYRNEKIIFADFKKNRPLTIILGANGSGKTNLLNAVTWCLYGKELHIGGKYRGLPIVNTLVLSRLKPKEICHVEVEIQFRDKNEDIIVVKRSVDFQKLENNKYKKVSDPAANMPDGSRLEMLRQIRRDIIPISDPSYIIQQLIPEKINEYFFFDGERLDYYFKEESGKNIEEAVFKISQLELLERVIEHLKAKKRDFLKKSKDLSPNIEKIRDKIDILETSLKNYKESLEKIKIEKNIAEKNEKEISEKLRSNSIPNIKKLEEERIRTEKDLKRLDQHIDTLSDEKFDYLIKEAPSIFSYNAIVRMEKMIDKKKKAKEIPPTIDRTLLENLLEEGRCICGTDISEKNVHRENIERLLKKFSKLSEISVELLEEHTNLRAILDEVRDFRDKQIEYGKKLKKFEEERKEKSKLLTMISEKIGECDIEEIRRLETKLQEYKKAISEAASEIGKREARIEQTEKSIIKLEEDLKEELSKEERYRQLRKICSFCDDCLDAANKIINDIMEEIRKEIEDKTRKQFLDLIWKKETYKDVKIDDHYTISVLDQAKRESMGTLGAGEREALALSFMAALNSVSGFDVPIIIDTPLARISREPKKNIAENLPNYFEGKQVTLLVTEEEYTSEVRERLSKSIGREYRIEFKELEEGCESRVMQYGE